jgi:hypothetical protein
VIDTVARKTIEDVIDVNGVKVHESPRQTIARELE